MPGPHPHILTIGGFDPCNGAGITQDVKTMEALDCNALSVQTALTVQHDDEVRKVYWTGMDVIREQIDVLMDRYPVQWIKISLARDLATTRDVISAVLSKNPSADIVWDPVRRSSSGYEFNRQQDRKTLESILDRVYLALPNWSEMGHWSEGPVAQMAENLSARANIYLKGGHRPGKTGTDLLFTLEGERIEISPERVSEFTKHGSGCVFASALTAGLAKGSSLTEAAAAAKKYVTDFLDSSPGKLGRHVNETDNETHHVQR